MTATAVIYYLDAEEHVLSSRELEFAPLDELRQRLEADHDPCAMIEAWEGGVCILRLRRAPNNATRS